MEIPIRDRLRLKSYSLLLRTPWRFAICGASPCCAWHLTAICVDESVDPEYVNRKSCMHRRKKIAATSLYLQAKNLDFGLAGNL